MKAIYATILALLTVFALPALAVTGEVKTLGGCEIVDKGGYWNKVDADCEFGFANEDGEDRDLRDHDNDPSTPPVRG